MGMIFAPTKACGLSWPNTEFITARKTTDAKNVGFMHPSPDPKTRNRGGSYQNNTRDGVSDTQNARFAVVTPMV
jgi:hypothetical protein